MMSWFRKALPWICLVLASLALVGAIIYRFGGPVAPPKSAVAEYQREVAEGIQPPLEQRFVIPIPGCVCHSDNPSSVVRHSVRRLSECSGCHG